MASPQLEDGHLRIANEIVEALMRTNLSAYQSRILCAIWRKTYGWGKKEDWIPNSQLAELTGIRKQHVSRTVKELLDRNVVTKSGYKIAFNKDYTQWRELPKQVSVTQRGNKVTDSGNRVTSLGELKRNYIKRNNKDNIADSSESLSLIFNFWNEQSIIAHRDLKKFESHIKARLKHYTVEEIKEAIANYSAILKSDRHYFSHKWGLDEFLSRKNGLDKFLTVNNPFDAFLKREYRGDQVARSSRNGDGAHYEDPIDRLSREMGLES